MRIEIRTDGRIPAVVVKKRRGKAGMVPVAAGPGARKGDKVSQEALEQFLTAVRALAPGQKMR